MNGTLFNVIALKGSFHRNSGVSVCVVGSKRKIAMDANNKNQGSKVESNPGFLCGKECFKLYRKKNLYICYLYSARCCITTCNTAVAEALCLMVCLMKA